MPVINEDVMIKEFWGICCENDVLLASQVRIRLLHVII
jgi:hypothetical protein